MKLLIFHDSKNHTIQNRLRTATWNLRGLQRRLVNENRTEGHRELTIQKFFIVSAECTDYDY